MSQKNLIEAFVRYNSTTSPEITTKIEPSFVQDFCQCLFSSNILQNIDTTLHIFNVVTEVFDLEHEESKIEQSIDKEKIPVATQGAIIKPCLKSENIGHKLNFLLQKTAEFQAKRSSYEMKLEKEQKLLEEAKRRFQELSQRMNHLILDSETIKNQIEFYHARINDINALIRSKENECQHLAESQENAIVELKRSEEAFLRQTSKLKYTELELKSLESKHQSLDSHLIELADTELQMENLSSRKMDEIDKKEQEVESLKLSIQKITDDQNYRVNEKMRNLK